MCSDSLDSQLSPQDLWRKMMNGMKCSYDDYKAGRRSRYWQAYAILTRDIDNMKAGTKVRVVMASRFGDVGITRNLKSESGYSARIPVIQMDGTDWPEQMLEIVKVFEI